MELFYFLHIGQQIVELNVVKLGAYDTNLKRYYLKQIFRFFYTVFQHSTAPTFTSKTSEK